MKKKNQARLSQMKMSLILKTKLKLKKRKVRNQMKMRTIQEKIVVVLMKKAQEKRKRQIQIICQLKKSSAGRVVVAGHAVGIGIGRNAKVAIIGIVVEREKPVIGVGIEVKGIVQDKKAEAAGVRDQNHGQMMSVNQVGGAVVGIPRPLAAGGAIHA